MSISRSGTQTNPSWTSMKVDLKNGNVQSFNTRWDVTIVAMKKQPDEESLANLHHRQFNRKAKAIFCLFTFEDIVLKMNSRGFTGLEQMAVRYLEQKIREKQFSYRERQLGKPASGTAAAKDNAEDKGKTHSCNG